MSGSTTVSWWQYSRWVWNITRNSRITNPTGVELVAVQAFVTLFYNPADETGTRSWLATSFDKKSASASPLAPSAEPVANLIEMLGVIARDLKKIPITEAEAGYVDTLITATGTRRLGAGTQFGNIGGSIVTVP